MTAGQQIALQTGGVAAGQTCAYALAHQPSAVGPLETEVTLHFTDGQVPPQHRHDVVLKLAGIGIGVQARLHPPSVNFGATAVGTETAPQSVQIENIGRPAPSCP